jgi:hypothetical protein
MINMHHCRLQNTLEALRECCETLEYEEVSDLSESEQKALAKLLQLCKKMSHFYADHARQGL